MQMVFVLISLFFQTFGAEINEMPLLEVYMRADEMKSFDFGLVEYSDSIESKGFDFVTLKSRNQGDDNGYYQSYYNKNCLQKVVKFSSEGNKEYVIFTDTRNKDYSFLWLFFYEKRQPMTNGFFLNIGRKELYFVGLSEPMGSLLEIADNTGRPKVFDFGIIYTLPHWGTESVIGQIAHVDERLFPKSILHYRSGKPFGVENIDNSTLNVFSFTVQDCEENIPALSEMNFFKIGSILSGNICFDGDIFGLKDRYRGWQDYYSSRTF